MNSALELLCPVHHWRFLREGRWGEESCPEQESTEEQEAREAPVDREGVRRGKRRRVRLHRAWIPGPETIGALVQPPLGRR